MKKLLPFLSLVLASLLLSAQAKKLNEIASFEIRNSGTMIDKNNDVDGYYFFYEFDKLKGGKREFSIQLLDNNLNTIATKSYIDDKHVYLANSKFNNQSLMFAMINKVKKNYKLVSYDRAGNQNKTIEIPFNSAEQKWLEMNMQSGNFNMLLPVDNKGFLFNYTRDNKKIGYGLKYIATDGGKSWDYNSPDEIKELCFINPIEANEEVVVAVEMRKKSLMSRTVETSLVVIDINTGKLLFKDEFNRADDPRMFTNAFLIENNQLVLLGEYFKKGDNIFTDKSIGLFAKVSDLSGKTISDNKIGWEEKINKMMPPDSDGKTRTNSYVYFHDIIRAQDGKYFFVGEKFRKAASAGGIALAALAAAGGSYGGVSVTKLVITDAVIFEFDKEFNLGKIHQFEKGKSNAPSLTDFGSPQLNAHALKSFGAFDYEYTQFDKDRNRFYVNFIDVERLKDEASKAAFKTVIYNDGNFSEDKIYLQKDSGKIKFRVFPAKLGNVMILEYNKKEKTIDLHLEKLNIK